MASSPRRSPSCWVFPQNSPSSLLSLSFFSISSQDVSSSFLESIHPIIRKGERPPPWISMKTPISTRPPSGWENSTTIMIWPFSSFWLSYQSSSSSLSSSTWQATGLLEIQCKISCVLSSPYRDFKSLKRLCFQLSFLI